MIDSATRADCPARGIPGRVCAIRKSAAAIREAHRKIRRDASRKGHCVQPATLRFAEYVIVFRTFPEPPFSAADGRRAGDAHRQTGIEIVRAPLAQFSADGFQPAVLVAGETPVGQARMVHADRFPTRVRRLPLAPHVELRVHALDRRRPLRIAVSPQKRKVFVGHAEAARLQFDARLDTVPVPLRVHGEVGFEREPGAFLSQV